MINRLGGLITRNGNIVRSGMARPATIARYLAAVDDVAAYHVTYWRHGRPHRVTAEGFLTLYQAGRIPAPLTLKQMQDEHPV